jgi:hypothetical protein
MSGEATSGYGLWIPEHHENIKNAFPEVTDVPKLVEDLRALIYQWFEEHIVGVMERSQTLTEVKLRAIAKEKGINLPDGVRFWG